MVLLWMTWQVFHCCSAVKSAVKNVAAFAACCGVSCSVRSLSLDWIQCRGCCCCSVLQCVALCCSVLQCIAGCCRVLPGVAVCCSVLKCVVVSCSVLQCRAR